eukprot:365501-Chlamydomonas_euryale.AAC.3
MSPRRIAATSGPSTHWNGARAACAAAAAAATPPSRCSACARSCCDRCRACPAAFLLLGLDAAASSRRAASAAAHSSAARAAPCSAASTASSSAGEGSPPCAASPDAGGGTPASANSGLAAAAAAAAATAASAAARSRAGRKPPMKSDASCQQLAHRRLAGARLAHQQHRLAVCKTAIQQRIQAAHAARPHHAGERGLNRVGGARVCRRRTRATGHRRAALVRERSFQPAQRRVPIARVDLLQINLGSAPAGGMFQLYEGRTWRRGSREGRGEDGDVPMP